MSAYAALAHVHVRMAGGGQICASSCNEELHLHLECAVDIKGNRFALIHLSALRLDS